jgi:hypothetical protein
MAPVGSPGAGFRPNVDVDCFGRQRASDAISVTLEAGRVRLSGSPRRRSRRTSRGISWTAREHRLRRFVEVDAFLRKGISHPRRVAREKDLEGEQSPWKDRASDVGNDIERYGLVGGAKP